MGVSKPLRGIFAPFRVQPMSATFPRGFDPRLPLQPPAGVEIEYVSVSFGLQGILIVRANCASGGPPSPGSPAQARGRTAARDAVGKLLHVASGSAPTEPTVEKGGVPRPAGWGRVSDRRRAAAFNGCSSDGDEFSLGPAARASLLEAQDQFEVQRVSDPLKSFKTGAMSAALDSRDL